jgi:hypothetical protein
LPDEATLFLSLRPAKLAVQSDFRNLVDQSDGVWQQTFGRVLQAFRLDVEGISQLTWVSTDLAAWPEPGLVIIQFQSAQDAAALALVGQAVNLSLSDIPCRRLADAAWPHPFARIDPRTIATGHGELLRSLADRSQRRTPSGPLGQLLTATAPSADFRLLLDLTAARRAQWKLPTTLLDVWPSGKQAWHTIWEMPEYLGCSMQCSDHWSGELALVCDGETAAEAVDAALSELLPAAADPLGQQIAAVPQRLLAGQFTVTAADKYSLVLQEAQAILRTAQHEMTGATVWVRAQGELTPVVLATTLIDTRPVIQTDWLSAAAKIDEANHGRLLAGLGGYQKAEGRMPRAVAGGALLPPQTRLSWIATMLPYYGYLDWHRRFDPAYPWNGPQNRSVARQTLPEVINPAVRTRKSEAGFPVTHYVGVAGVGTDAGRLDADDPRAGVFGYARGTRPEEIADGAGNTIALLGVTERLGPWAAGGDPTTRALTQRPYIDGPDGFGSGQPDGMFVGMADGSVRFLSKNIDPVVLEQLATINGGRSQTTVSPSDGAAPSQPVAEAPPPQPQSPARQPATVADAAPVEPTTDGTEEIPPATAAAPMLSAQFDLEERLSATVPAIELGRMPLIEAVDLLSALGAIPVAFDPEVLEQLGVRLHDPVEVRLADATFGEILQAVAASKGLAAVIDQAYVLMTSPPGYRETLEERRYAVSDLVGPEQAATAQLAGLVENLVAPDSWRRRGGQGTIDADAANRALLIEQTGAVHHQIQAFCDKLRDARRMDRQDRGQTDRHALATRLDRAQAVLDHRVTANFHEPTPLKEVLAYLGKAAAADILIDGPAFGAAGLVDRANATVTAEDQPLSVALGELLGPLGLAYRAISANMLQVTTDKALAAGLELEFYPVGPLSADKAADLVERIKGQVAPATWNDAGGPGAVRYDAGSGCLIVLQSQPVQAAVERLVRAASRQ